MRNLLRFNHTLCPFLHHFPPSTATALAQTGYAIVDNLISPSTAASLREEIDALANENHLRPNETHLVQARQRLTFAKRAVAEAELNLLSESILTQVPKLNTLKQDTSISTLLSVFWPRITLTKHAVKIQRSENGCFPIHIDSTPSVDNRLVTGILYLHDWNQSHGGCLRIYPKPSTFIDIHPKQGRLVLLSSTNMHHRVLPSYHTRYVITIWCSGQIRKDAVEKHTQLEETLVETLLSQQFRDMTFRLLLAEQWEESLWQSHDKTTAQEAVRVHRDTLKRVQDCLPGALASATGAQQAQILEVLDSSCTGMQRLFASVGPQRQDLLRFRW